MEGTEAGSTAFPKACSAIQIETFLCASGLVRERGGQASCAFHQLLGRSSGSACHPCEVHPGTLRASPDVRQSPPHSTICRLVRRPQCLVVARMVVDLLGAPMETCPINGTHRKDRLYFPTAAGSMSSLVFLRCRPDSTIDQSARRLSCWQEEKREVGFQAAPRETCPRNGIHLYHLLCCLRVAHPAKFSVCSPMVFLDSTSDQSASTAGNRPVER